MALLALCSVCSACGGDDEEEVVPIEQIPPDKPLVSLAPAEQRGLCAWGKAVAQMELPPAGTTLNCGGLTITVSQTSCVYTTADASRCDASVMEWQACLPHFFSRLGDDLCQILPLQAPGALEAFVNETPGCEGLGGCTSTML
jgi:hypothetical protein